MPTPLVRNANIVVTMDDGRRGPPGAGLFARDGIIERVGPTGELPRDADVVLDMAGRIVLPGSGAGVGYRMRLLTLEPWTAVRRGGLAT
jgi:cytosine/adenosine deaminase-related metal-dependent hydrolase